MFIAGFQITQLLFNNSRTAIHRAIREVDGVSVILKQASNPSPSYLDRIRLQHEYEVLSKLHIPEVLSAYSLEKDANSYALVLADFQGQSLDHVLKHAGPLPLTQFYTLALAFAHILQQIHAAGVIHKDINPHNFLLDEHGNYRLIDFGLASLLRQHEQELVNPDLLEGTLPYIAPEQTGRMNRGIDYRCDYYSLGVTFYQMLTGHRPFTASDAIGWVHCHIAKTPPSIVQQRADVPQMLENIVFKLMAKNAEQRYQSMAGLLADLQQCQQGHEHFELGRYELYEQFKIPQHLYGREAETRLLEASFKRVAAGACEMLLVAGYSGIGKSSLVNEIHKPLVEKHGLFISGKFDQFQRDIPYSALSNAFQGLMKHLLILPKPELSNWQEQLSRALGPNAQVMVDLIPNLAKVLGPQPAVANLGAEENQNRFYQCFRQLLGVFTRPECPLVLFLDDLQWADTATLNLLRNLMLSGNNGYFMLMGAYRDNEVDAAHPFIILLEELKQNALTIHELTLKPLALADLQQLLADCLYSPLTQVQDLAELILHKTGGNPFFVIQFLKNLYQEQLLSFDGTHWAWNTQQIQAKDITDNVVEFMLRKLRTLPENAQHLLRLAACIGNSFSLHTLALIAELPIQNVAKQLWPVVAEGLLLPQGPAHQQLTIATEQTESEAIDKFLHDRVQQAAYALIDEAQKQATHLKIARLLYQNAQHSGQFDIVEHYNKARELLVDVAEKQTLARLNLAAGQRAQKSTAYTPAIEFYRVAASLLDDSVWQSEHGLLFGIHQGIAECLLLSGKVDAGIEHANFVLQHCINREQTVAINNMLILYYGGTGQVSKSVDMAVALLHLYHENLPRPCHQHHVLWELATTLLRERGKDEAYFKNAPQITNPDILQVLNLLKEMVASCYLEGTLLLPVVILRLFKITLKHGNSFATSYVFSTYGLLWSKLGNPSTSYKYGMLAMEYNQYTNDQALISRASHLVVSYCMYWKKDLHEVMEVRKQVLQKLLNTGELIWASYLYIFGFWQEMVLAKSALDMLKLAERELYAANVRKQPEPIMVHGLHLGLLLNWTTNGGTSLSHAGCDEAKVAQFLAQSKTTNCAAFCYAIDRLVLEYMAGNYSAAITAATQPQINDDVIDPSYNTTIYTLFSCLSMLAASADEFKQHQKRYQHDKRLIQKWAKHGPVNFAMFNELVLAEEARVKQQRPIAMTHYQQAIRAAQAMGSLLFEALCVERYAHFWLAQSEHKVAQIYMRDAANLYQQWGMLAKVKQLQTQYAELLAAPSTTLTTLASSTAANSALDIASVIKVTQTISKEIVLKQLLSKLLQTLVENAGASRGCLVLKQNDKWLIQAQLLDEATQVLQNLAYESSNDIPVSLIRYVSRTEETIVLENTNYAQLYAEDPYILAHQPQSLLVMPIHSQGALYGILYLENTLIAGAFSIQRLELLKVLASQIAISLENALFYEQLEQKVAERTADLAQALEELRASQQQLVESEKMVMLGSLVAGVAHEINTPVGIGVTAASHLHSKTREIVQLYENDELTEEAYQDYLQNALDGTQILLKNMQTAANLVRSFKLVAVDQSSEVMRSFDLKEYIQTILLSLRPELRNTQITLECPEPLILNSYPGDLSQILTNLIMNSINHGFRQHNKTGEILIQISDEAEYACIRYSDNGKGIASEIISKVFDPFFTTDRQSGRSGLGMHIVYNLVTQRLAGSISCEDTHGQGALFLIRVKKTLASQSVP